MPSPLPERYQHYAQPGPTARSAPVELYDERDPVVWVPSAEDPSRSVAVRRSALQPATPTPPRDLSPQPLLDPLAQRLLAGGVGSGVALWGGGQFLVGAGQLVSSLSGVGALLFFLALAGGRMLLARPVAGTRIEVHNHASWFGSNTTKM